MRNLFLVNTVYQLLVVMVLRTQYSRERSDIVLSSRTSSFRQICQNETLKQCFDHVYFADQDKDGASKALAFIKSNFASASYIQQVAGLSCRPAAYDRIFFFNRDALMMAYYQSVPARQKVQLYNFEEGCISYIRTQTPIGKREDRLGKVLPCLGKKNTVRFPYTALLFHPELYVGVKTQPIERIPIELSRDENFIDTLNKIFDFRREAIRQAVVIFEESTDFIEDPAEYYGLLKQTIAGLGAENVILKRHPRNTGALPFDVPLMKTAAPWELYVLNGLAKGKTLMSIASSACMNSLILSSKADDIAVTLLYQCIKSKLTIMTEPYYGAYITKLKKAYDNLFVPADPQELKAYLRNLEDSLSRKER